MMEEKPSGGPSPQDAAATDSASVVHPDGGRESSPHESFGPLEVVRQVKEDGRMLLVYRRSSGR